MHLSLIDPDNPAATFPDVTLQNLKEDPGADLPMPVWNADAGRYGAGKTLKRAAGGNVSDLAGWQAVIAEDDGSVVTGGEIDEVTSIRHKYRIVLVETPSPTPSFSVQSP